MKGSIWAVGAVVALGVAGLAGLWAAGLLPGAGGDDQRFRSPVGAVPATPQRPGDPVAGREALLNAPYVSCGMPLEAWRRLSPETDPADLLPGRSGRNADLPYFLTANVTDAGTEVAATNCLVCHAGRIDGQLIVGLGNAFGDFTQDARSLPTRVGSMVRGAAETAAWQHWADRIEGIAPYIRTGTIGDNPATNLTWALMAHRDPESMAWSDTPLIDPPQADPIPLRVPPWWWMQKKNAMFYTTIGRGDHARFMLLASMLCADTVEEVARIDSYAADIRAYLESLTPPPFPHAVDADLAERGRAVFEAQCSECHGTYGAAPEYPNKVIALDAIGTDPEYAMAATSGARDRFYDWVARSPFGETVRTAPARGYLAPPLDGIWAAAPFLHNGSVPDLRGVLDSRQRPRFWRHLDPPEFDPDRVGWRHEVLDAGKAAADDPAQRVRTYDTTLPGYGRGGHTYGDDLTEAERRAVLEYLKTL